MKKLLVIVCVFGRYQDYIPLFVLSWLRAYPYADIRIYLQDTLNQDIKKQLESVGALGRANIIEDAYSMVSFTEKALLYPQISKCFRWLVYEPDFKEYEAIYIGDIDIIIVKEKEPLFDQHMKHCAYCKLPYSNIIRTKEPVNLWWHPKRLNTYVRQYGFRNVAKYMVKSKRVLYRLSGLHFFRAPEYLEAVMPLQAVFAGYLNRMAESKSKDYNIVHFNNEAMLFDLVKASGLGLPKDEDGNNAEVNIEENPQAARFRPHHGIHLGIFRNNKNTSKNKHILDSNVYKEYYQDFLEFEKTDEYKEISKHFSQFINEHIRVLHDYYRSLMTVFPSTR